MISKYERAYLESTSRIPAPIRVREWFSESEQTLEVLYYIKQAIRNQPEACESDLKRCDEYLNRLIVENECNVEWEKYWAEKEPENAPFKYFEHH